jgi:DNA-binding transcriptional regulator LsrR (DeoR family)
VDGMNILFYEITSMEDLQPGYQGIREPIEKEERLYDSKMAAKVAHMLVNELDTFNKLKKHEIAYMLHIQPETLSRILNKLTRNGTIEIEKNSVVILNIQELKDIYE